MFIIMLTGSEETGIQEAYNLIENTLGTSVRVARYSLEIRIKNKFEEMIGRPLTKSSKDVTMLDYVIHHICAIERDHSIEDLKHLEESCDVLVLTEEDADAFILLNRESGLADVIVPDEIYDIRLVNMEHNDSILSLGIHIESLGDLAIRVTAIKELLEEKIK